MAILFFEWLSQVFSIFGFHHSKVLLVWLFLDCYNYNLFWQWVVFCRGFVAITLKVSKSQKPISLFSIPLKNERKYFSKGQLISKQNCRAVTSPKEWKDEFIFLCWWPETWISISSFKYIRVIKIEKQIHLFVFWEKLWHDNFVSRSTDL